MKDAIPFPYILDAIGILKRQGKIRKFSNKSWEWIGNGGKIK